MTQASDRPDRAITVETAEAGLEVDELKPVRERFAVMQTFWSEIHQVALEDDRFVAGEQWPEQIKHEREEDGRPCLTYNLLPSFHRQITNKVRQERPQLKVRPVEGTGPRPPEVKNLAGSQDYELADVYSGVVKNIEHVSSADQAYDTAVKHAVDHGFGWFGLRNQWCRHDPFVQELVIFRVKDSYSVLSDPSAQEADLSDMQDAFLFTDVHRTTFEAKYPDASTAGFNPGLGFMDGWYDSENVRVAQYYRIDHRDDEVLLLSNGKVVYLSDVKDVLDEMERDEGIHIAQDDAGREMRRKVKRPVCTWQKITGVEVLEGPLDLPFEHVPLFAVLGEEMIVDGKTRYESAGRHAKGAQRSYNYWRTAAAETVALAPRAPWMGTAKQFEGHEYLYEESNRKNHPYLLYNHIDGVPPPQRQFPNGIAAGELQMAIQDGTDMQTIIGLHDASLGRESNERSGRAIERRQTQGLTSTFQFPDNLGRALKHMGRVAVTAIPRVYDTRRVLRIRLPDDSEDFVEINQLVRDEQTGNEVLVHDLGVGRYDIVMEVGEDYATQRQEARDTQIEILKLIGPEAAAQIVHKVVKNIGGPGADEIYTVLRKMLPDELKSEEERRADLPAGVTLDEQGNAVVEETGEPYQAPPTPAQKIRMAELEAEQAKQAAEQAKAAATTKDAEAKMAKAQADLKEAELKLAELTANGTADEAGRDEQFLSDITRIVQETMTQHEQNPNAHKQVHDQMLDEQAVELLERVKRYVDRRVGAAARPAATGT